MVHGFVRNIDVVQKHGYIKRTLKKLGKINGFLSERKERNKNQLYSKFPASIEYFHRRNVGGSKNVFLSGETKSALAKLQKNYCPVCDMSLSV